MTPDQIKEQAERKKKADQEIFHRVSLYRRVFQTKDGQAVLADMGKAAGLTERVFMLADRGDHAAYDPLKAALKDGHRDAVIRIHDILNTSIEDEPKKKPRIKK